MPLWPDLLGSVGLGEARNEGYEPILMQGRSPALSTSEWRTVYGIAGARPVLGEAITLDIGGAGAAGTAIVQGLDANWERITDVVPVSGLAESNLEFLRVNDVLWFGAPGDIFVTAHGASRTDNVPDDGDDVLDKITADWGYNRSWTGIYSVPAGKQLLPIASDLTVARLPGSSSGVREAEFRLMYQSWSPGQPPVPLCIYASSMVSRVQYYRRWEASPPLPPKTDLWVEARALDADTILLGNATLLLVPEGT